MKEILHISRGKHINFINTIIILTINIVFEKEKAAIESSENDKISSIPALNLNPIN